MDYLFKGLLNQVLPCYVAEIDYAHHRNSHHVPYSAPSTPTYQQGTTCDLGKRILVFFAGLLLLIFLNWIVKLSQQVTTSADFELHLPVYNMTVQNITLPTPSEVQKVAQPQDTYCSSLLDCRDG
jgi:hypothetical protein